MDDTVTEHSTQLKEKQSNDLCTSTWLSSSSLLLLLLLYYYYINLIYSDT